MVALRDLTQEEIDGVKKYAEVFVDQIKKYSETPMPLDYSEQSIKCIDEWLDYFSKRERSPHPDLEELFDKRLAESAGCYLGEVIRKQFPETHWCICDDGKICIFYSGIPVDVVSLTKKRLENGQAESISQAYEMFKVIAKFPDRDEFITMPVIQ